MNRTQKNRYWFMKLSSIMCRFENEMLNTQAVCVSTVKDAAVHFGLIATQQTYHQMIIIIIIITLSLSLSLSPPPSLSPSHLP